MSYAPLSPAEIHFKLCKKVAQLTRVIFQLNTRNEETEVLIKSASEHSEKQVERVVQIANLKLAKLEEQLKGFVDRERNFQVAAEKMKSQVEQEREVWKRKFAEVEKQANSEVENWEVKLFQLKEEFEENSRLMENNKKMEVEGLLEAQRLLEIETDQLLANKDLEISTFKADVQSELESQVIALNEKVENARRDRIDMETELELQRNKTASAEEAIAAANEKITRLTKTSEDARLELIRQHAEQLKHGNSETERLLSLKETELSGVRASLSSFEKEAAAQISSLRSEISTLKENAGNLTENSKLRIRHVEAALEMSQAAQSKTEEELSRKNEEISMLNRDISDLNERFVASVASSSAAASDEEAKHQVEISRLKDEVNRVRGNLALANFNFEAEIKRQKCETESALTVLNAAREEVSLLQAASAQDATRISDLNLEISTLREVDADYKLQIEEMNQDILRQGESASQQSAALMSEISSSKAVSAQLAGQVEELTRKIKLNETETELRVREISELQRKLILSRDEASAELTAEQLKLAAQLSSVTSDLEISRRNEAQRAAELEAAAKSLEQLRISSDAEIRNVHAAAQSQLAQMEALHSSKEAQFIEELKKLDFQLSNYQKLAERNREEATLKFLEVQKSETAARAALTLQHREEMEAIKAHFQDTISSMENAFRTQIEALESEIVTKERIIADERRNFQDEILSFKRQAAKENERIREELNLDLEKVKVFSQKELSQLREKFKSEQTQLTATIEQIKNELTGREGDIDLLRCENRSLVEQVEALRDAAETASTAHARAVAEVMEAAANEAESARGLLAQVKSEMASESKQQLARITEQAISEKFRLQTEIGNWQERYNQLIEKFENRPARPEDVAEISALTQLTAEQKMKMEKMNMQLQQFRMELLNREENYNRVFNASPNIGIVNPLNLKPRK